MENNGQVWSWNSLQRSTDSLMNKAYIFACKRLISKAFQINPQSRKMLDVGAGSGLVLRHVTSMYKIDFDYTGIDLSEEGLKKLDKRATALDVKVKTQVWDASTLNKDFENNFDIIFSNFCFYTIKDDTRRAQALINIAKYMKQNGTFHIALPSEKYSAFRIAKQCFRDEWSDNQPLHMKILRSFLLVPYQWHFVLKPIEAKVNEGVFLRFTKDKLLNEFNNAGLVIDQILLDYGSCGYHLHGHKNVHIN